MVVIVYVKGDAKLRKHVILIGGETSTGVTDVISYSAVLPMRPTSYPTNSGRARPDL